MPRRQYKGKYVHWAAYGRVCVYLGAEEDAVKIILAQEILWCALPVHEKWREQDCEMNVAVPDWSYGILWIELKFVPELTKTFRKYSSIGENKSKYIKPYLLCSACQHRWNYLLITNLPTQNWINIQSVGSFFSHQITHESCNIE